MKKLLAYSTALLIIFASLVLDVSCMNKTCKDLEEKCFIDSDCCSEVCSRMLEFLTIFSGYCEKPNDFILKILKNMDHDEDFESNKCAYYKENDTKIRDELMERFNVNAAMGLLPPNTTAEVTYKNRKTLVTISDRQPRVNETYLELSEEAAKKLGIEEEGIFNCYITLPVSTKEFYMRYIKTAVYFLPFFMLIIIIRIYS